MKVKKRRKDKYR